MPGYLIAPCAIPVVSIARGGVGQGIYEGTRKGVAVVVNPRETFENYLALVETSRGGEYVLSPDVVTPDLVERVSLRVRYAVAVAYQAEDWRVCITFPTVDSVFGGSLIDSLRATLECPQVLNTVRDRRIGRMGWHHTPRPDSPLRDANWDGFPSLPELLDKLFAARTIHDLDDPRLK